MPLPIRRGLEKANTPSGLGPLFQRARAQMMQFRVREVCAYAPSPRGALGFHFLRNLHDLAGTGLPEAICSPPSPATSTEGPNHLSSKPAAFGPAASGKTCRHASSSFQHRTSDDYGLPIPSCPLVFNFGGLGISLQFYEVASRAFGPSPVDCLRLLPGIAT